MALHLEQRPSMIPRGRAPTPCSRVVRINDVALFRRLEALFGTGKSSTERNSEPMCRMSLR